MNAGEQTPPRELALAVRPCWNEIGVDGNGECQELRQFIHCRNCPVYARAGAQLLNRPAPQEYRRQWTDYLTQRRKAAAPTNTSALVLRLGAEWFGLPTKAFLEAIEPRQIHSVPHRRQGLLLGLVNVRGELWLCVSLGHLLQLEGLPSLERLRLSPRLLLAASWEGTRFVFPVDEVLGTHRFNQEELQALPPGLARSPQSYSQGVLAWRERTIGFLDAERLFAALNRNLG